MASCCTSPPPAPRVYKYTAPRPSFFFEHVLDKFYSAVASLLPTWLKPNTITVCGLIFTLTASCFLLVSLPPTLNVALPSLVPSLEGAPQWHSALDCVGVPLRLLFGMAGVLNMMYCIADNCDGKQARRLKLSSRVGEYLDHGGDCFTALLSSFLAPLILGMPTQHAALCVILVAVMHQFAHIIHFRESKLIWGTRVATVDEAMVLFAVVPFLRFVFPQIPTMVAVPSFITNRLEGVPVVAFMLKRSYVPYIVWFGFLALAAAMLYKFSRQRLSVILEPSSIFYGLFIAAMCALPFTEAHQSSGLSFVSPAALWGVMFASISANVFHMPMYSRCALKPDLEYWPLAISLVAILVYAASPLFGCLLGFASHVFQLVVHVVAITTTERLEGLKKTTTS